MHIAAPDGRFVTPNAVPDKIVANFRRSASIRTRTVNSRRRGHNGLMALKIPSPFAVADRARSAVGQVVETVAMVATVPFRVMSLIGQAELIASRITVLIDEIEGVVQRVDLVFDDVERITGGATRVVAEAESVAMGAGRVVGSAAAATDAATAIITDAAATTGAASAVVVRASRATHEAEELLHAYDGTLRKAAPLAAQFVDELSPEEISAAIKMVDTFPELHRHLVDDVLPLLGKLDQVGPDLHNLLEVTKDLHLAIAGLPGLKLLRRRGEERVAEEEESATNARK
jgi:uncharacterized protein YoxC